VRQRTDQPRRSRPREELGRELGRQWK